MDQTDVNSPSDFSNNESDWQTVPPNSLKRLRSPNNTSPTIRQLDTNIFISTNRFTPIAPINEAQSMETTDTNSVNNDKTF